MDSGGNEVIIVEENLATTNGINGNHEEVVVLTTSDMKTRSRGTEGVAPAPDDAAVKPKTRSSRTTNAQKNVNDEKSGSDTEKKPKTNSAAGGDAKSAQKKPAVVAAAAAVVAEGTPVKKKPERDDDSGINSRSSSVSNEDTYSSRMRTRSKTAVALSSSTPASVKKGASRMPLSTYDFEDISFDEDPTTSGNQLKRKATLYVEEMEDEPENEKKDEPPAKRGSYFAIFSRFSFPSMPSKFFKRSQTDNVEVAKDDQASQTQVTKVNDNELEKEHVASQTEIAAATTTQDETPPGTCAVM